MEKDPQAVDFLYPVDYVALNILDYPKIITHPMDLGTVKKNLENGEYKLFQDFMSDINLIWKNCRTYNQPGSEIVKMANHCDKKIKQLIDKQFKNYRVKFKTPADLAVSAIDYNCGGCYMQNLASHRAVAELNGIRVNQHNLPLEILLGYRIY